MDHFWKEARGQKGVAYQGKALGHVLKTTPSHAALSQGQDSLSGVVGKMPRHPDPRTSRSLA